MCAIAGILGVGADAATLKTMLHTMERRGPDDSGMYQEDDVTLLHRRLSIIDPLRGKQPMGLSHQGEYYVIVYNGELYNTQEIRQELEELGHRFASHCDTEVVLHAYAQWKENCLEKFNGIFGFAVWQQNRKKLFMARDRIGVKPFFYTQLANSLVFASEMKTILAHPAVKPQLDETGAAQLLLLGPGRLPGSGVFHGIQELEPGCFGCYEAGKLTIRRYWKLCDREHTDDFAATVEKVRFLVTDAVKRQMVSDVPIGTFLSGGLDSSIICALCAREMERRGERLHTFSVDYLNNDRYFAANKFQPESDTGYIHKMVKYLDSNHHWTVLSPEVLVDCLEGATIARDLPGMADVDFSLLAFCKEIRSHVKVALSGECADEIFGGYPWYRDPEIRNSAGFPWAQNTSDRAVLLSEPLLKKLKPEEFVMDAYETTCRESDILPGNSSQERRMKEMVNLNFRWFMQTLLDRKDRMSMYTSLEVRVPFCDYRIAEYLYGVPWEFKDYQGREKGLLREAVKGLLPERVLYRKKSPYPKTFDPHYTHLVQNRLERLMGEDSPLWRLVAKDRVQQLMEKDAQWPWYGQLMRRPQIMAYLLQLDFWFKHYQVEILF